MRFYSQDDESTDDSSSIDWGSVLTQGIKTAGQITTTAISAANQPQTVYVSDGGGSYAPQSYAPTSYVPSTSTGAAVAKSQSQMMMFLLFGAAAFVLYGMAKKA